MSEGAFKDSGTNNKNTQISYFVCPWNDNTMCSGNRTTRRTISRPILRQHDFLALITISSASSYRSHIPSYFPISKLR